MTFAKTISHNVSLSLEKVVTGQPSFRYWRLRILYATIIGYAAFYLVRQNFSMAMPGIMRRIWVF